MSGKALKRSSYWLRERNKKTADVKKDKLEVLHTIEQLNKHGTRFENCSFVEKCGQKAQQKKVMENAIKYSKTSKGFFYPSMFRKFHFLCFQKYLIKYTDTV